MKSIKSYDGLEIAVIGLSGQFPESGNCRQFWQNLKEGRDLIRTFTDEELLLTGVPESELRDPRYVKSVGLLKDKDHFDHGFFGYSVEEAAIMDPQIRIFHEHCWKAIEDAGYAALIERNKIGVFAGASVNNNWKIYAYGKSADSLIEPFYQNMLTSQNFINTLASYKLDLRGPSVYVDTACSTSLVAIHLACRSLLTRECSMALAGGVYVNTIRRKGYFYQEGMIASKDGHCRTFDAEATGCASGEGIGIVVLKRMSEALKDRDHIYAVIRASAVNNDGNHKVGYTAPSVKGQAECIKSAYRLAGIDPRTISYIEAHGTATKLGDPVEIRGLNEAFGTGGRDKFCAIGSVKSNMGHLDSAAGVAGLIKTVLSLENKQIPPSLHFRKPNPEIDFDGGPFYVNAELKEWQSKDEAPLRAGVSSLGIGGTNAHVILEEAPEREESHSTRAYKLLTISAKTETSLTRYMHELKDFLAVRPAIDLDDMSYTLQVGRKHFGYRTSIVYKDKEELLDLLQQRITKSASLRTADRTQLPVFMFPGQGSQYAGMGRDLYENEAVFREEMDRGFEIMEKLTGQRFKEVLFPATQESERIHQTAYTQPIVFLFEYSLGRLLMSLGIAPRYMIGHSIGEYVAACLGGVFSFEDALQLVIQRGKLMNSLPLGNMLSIALKPEEAAVYLDEGISLAAVNGPTQVVLSGDPDATDRLAVKLEQAGIVFIKLHTSHAFHSCMLDPILEAFKNTLGKITFNKLRLPFVSNLTGDIITEEEASSSGYWVRHMRETVRFSDGLKTLLSLNQEFVFIEVGAGHALTSLLKQQYAGKSMPAVNNLVRSFKEQENDVAFFTRRLGELWMQGVPIDWDNYHRAEKRYRISLPTYSFEPNRYPTEVEPMETLRTPGLRIGAGYEARSLKDWIYYPFWKRTDPAALPENDTDRKVYLFFSFDNEFCQGLTERLSIAPERVIRVCMGEQFCKRNKVQYVVCPARPDDLSRLLSGLKEDGLSVTDVIYSWVMAVNESKQELREDNGAFDLAYLFLVRILQAFIKGNILEGIRVVVVTASLHRVIGVEKGAVTQSLALGFMKVLMQEHGLTCCNIDIDPGEAREGQMDMLIREIRGNRGREEHMVALRHGQRWIQDFQRNTQGVGTSKTVIRRGGTYLITGGLGNVGFVLAKYLIREYEAKVILIGRSKPEDQWNRLANLKDICADVTYFSADVANAEELERVVVETERSGRPIHGIIHTAGVSGNGHFELIEDITAEKSLAVFAPKILGLMNIYDVFKERKPDFIWLTSSISAVLGGLGFSAYSSANLFMDHFVASKSGEGINCKSVELAEMAFSEEEIEKRTDALKPPEIGTLFDWSLSVRDHSVISQTIADLPDRISKAYEDVIQGYIREEVTPDGIARVERPDLSTKYADPETETEKMLKSAFESFFGIECIGVDDNFFELGGDSLKGMMLLKKIKKEFNINLSIKDFMMNASVRQMSAKIDEIIWFRSDVEMENEISI